MTRLCLIGCGYMARENHAPSHRMLRENGAVELAGCCDLDLARAHALQREFGYSRAYDSVTSMLDTESPDAVCAVVPDTAMCQTVCECLERGIPVLLEKPPARNLQELDRMIELARSKGVLTQVAFNRRFMPVMVEFKRRLSLAGRPRRLLGTMTRVRRTDPDFTTTAIHLVDAVRHVLGDYAQVRFRYDERVTSDGAVTDYYAAGRARTGVELHLGICPAAGAGAEQLVAHYDDDRHLELHMPLPGNERNEPGWVGEWSTGRTDIISGEQLANSPEPHVRSGVFAENAAFIRAVQQGRRDTPNDLQSSRQSMQLMLAMRERRSEWSAA